MKNNKAAIDKIAKMSDIHKLEQYFEDRLDSGSNGMERFSERVNSRIYDLEEWKRSKERPTLSTSDWIMVGYAIVVIVVTFIIIIRQRRAQ